MYMTHKTTCTHFLIICFFILFSSFYINCDRDLGLGVGLRAPGLGLGLDTCGLGFALVSGDMVFITSLERICTD